MTSADKYCKVPLCTFTPYKFLIYKALTGAFGALAVSVQFVIGRGQLNPLCCIWCLWRIGEGLSPFGYPSQRCLHVRSSTHEQQLGIVMSVAWWYDFKIMAHVHHNYSKERCSDVEEFRWKATCAFQDNQFVWLNLAWRWTIFLRFGVFVRSKVFLYPFQNIGLSFTSRLRTGSGDFLSTPTKIVFGETFALKVPFLGK